MADKQEDRSVVKLRKIYEIPEDVQKLNAEATKREADAVLSPSQEEVDEVVTGRRGRTKKKDMAAETPEGKYKTRVVEPSRKK